jgi:hypothetical protein
MNAYALTFIGGYYNLTTCVYANDEEQAERTALTQIKDQYGWDLTSTYDELDILLEGTIA